MQGGNFHQIIRDLDRLATERTISVEYGVIGKGWKVSKFGTETGGQALSCGRSLPWDGASRENGRFSKEIPHGFRQGVHSVFLFGFGQLHRLRAFAFHRRKIREQRLAAERGVCISAEAGALCPRRVTAGFRCLYYRPASSISARRKIDRASVMSVPSVLRFAAGVSGLFSKLS